MLYADILSNYLLNTFERYAKRVVCMCVNGVRTQIVYSFPFYDVNFIVYTNSKYQ